MTWPWSCVTLCGDGETIILFTFSARCYEIFAGVIKRLDNAAIAGFFLVENCLTFYFRLGAGGELFSRMSHGRIVKALL